MKSTLEPQESRVSPFTSKPDLNGGSPAWEYCFLVQDQCNPGSAELTQLAAAGWFVVSFRTRFDSQREYLLKRPRR